MISRNFITFPLLFAAALFVFAGATLSRAGDTNLEQEVRELRAENSILKKQMQQQGGLLDSLAQKVGQLAAANSSREIAAGENPPPPVNGLNFGKVNLSGEGGVAFFNTGSEGFAPHSEFRVDEARLFVEAPLWKEVYFYGDIDLATRENTDLRFYPATPN